MGAGATVVVATAMGFLRGSNVKNFGVHGVRDTQLPPPAVAPTCPPRALSMGNPSPISPSQPLVDDDDAVVLVATADSAAALMAAAKAAAPRCTMMIFFSGSSMISTMSSLCGG